MDVAYSLRVNWTTGAEIVNFTGKKGEWFIDKASVALTRNSKACGSSPEPEISSKSLGFLCTTSDVSKPPRSDTTF